MAQRVQAAWEVRQPIPARPSQDRWTRSDGWEPLPWFGAEDYCASEAEALDEIERLQTTGGYGVLATALVGAGEREVWTIVDPADARADLADAVRRKLRLSEEEFDELFGLDGARLVRAIRAEHGLAQGGPDDPAELLGEQLVEAGVLTEEEGAWLDEE